jgi:hypothetical protein
MIRMVIYKTRLAIEILKAGDTEKGEILVHLSRIVVGGRVFGENG